MLDTSQESSKSILFFPNTKTVAYQILWKNIVESRELALLPIWNIKKMELLYF